LSVLLYQNIKNTFLTVYNFADRVAAVEKLSGRKSLFMWGKTARNEEKDILYLPCGDKFLRIVS